MPSDRLITVCASCLTASCWHGRFMCDASRGADLVQKTAAELDALGLEHPDNYSVERVLEVRGG